MLITLHSDAITIENGISRTYFVFASIIINLRREAKFPLHIRSSHYLSSSCFPNPILIVLVFPHPNTHSRRRLRPQHPPSRILRPFDRQPIRLLISPSPIVTPQPLKAGVDPKYLPLFDARQNLLYQVAVLHRPLRRRVPVVLLPRTEPRRDAVYGVFRIGEDVNGPVQRG